MPIPPLPPAAAAEGAEDDDTVPDDPPPPEASAFDHRMPTMRRRSRGSSVKGCPDPSTAASDGEAAPKAASRWKTIGGRQR